MSIHLFISYVIMLHFLHIICSYLVCCLYTLSGYIYSYYSTSEIKRGTCQEFTQPACDEKVEDECFGSFVESGRIRTISYPLNDVNPWNDESNHTYCARADLYQVVDSSGRQLSIAHASKELSISFTGLGNDEEYLVDMESVDSPENSSIPIGAVIGCLVGGILLVIPLVAFFIAKKRHQEGGTQIHEGSTATADDTEVIDDGEIELV